MKKARVYDRSEDKFLLGLTLIPGLGSVRIRLLLDHLGSPRHIWSLTEKEIRSIKLPSDVRDSFLDNRKKIDLEREIDNLDKSNVTLLTLANPNYPKILREIYDPPAVLHVRGTLNPLSSKLAVVGTRLMTTYGHQVTETLTRDLAGAGLTIVSGLARGVDALAHRGALSADAETIAVLGSGLNKVYPAENKFLAEEITHRGAVISEFPLESEPALGTFPSRNRIISGLSLGVLVTEAGEDSGSLITANAASEQGRHVFSVPGSIFSKQSGGTNALLKIGAKPVTQAADILEELNIATRTLGVPMTEIKGENPTETKILEHLTVEPKHIDDLGRDANLGSARLGSALTVMVISGKVADLGGGFYARKH